MRHKVTKSNPLNNFQLQLLTHQQQHQHQLQQHNINNRISMLQNMNNVNNSNLSNSNNSLNSGNSNQEQMIRLELERLKREKERLAKEREEYQKRVNMFHFCFKTFLIHLKKIVSIIFSSIIQINITKS